MGLFVSSKDMLRGGASVDLIAGAMKGRLVYGNEGYLLLAERGPGYHAKPHSHSAEQLIHVFSGNTWVFIEDEAYRLGPGDFLRIPMDAVHWTWNMSSEPCMIAQTLAPVLDPESRAGTVALFAENEQRQVKIVPLRNVDRDVTAAEKRAVARYEAGDFTNKPGLFAATKDMTQGGASVDLVSGAMKGRLVYGNEAVLIVASRDVGYHAKPHHCAAEQLVHILTGHTWVFIEEEGYYLGPGDFLRIPMNAVHWTWNRDAEPFTSVQSSAPVLDPMSRAGTVGLFAENEERHVKIVPLEDDVRDVEEIEKRAIARRSATPT